jgi:iron(III) transport system permease protein
VIAAPAARTAARWAITGLAAGFLLPWYLQPGGLLSAGWVAVLFSSPESAPAALALARDGRWWLAPPLVLLAAALPVLRVPGRRRQGTILASIGLAALAWVAVQGLALGLRGWSWDWAGALLGPTAAAQPGMGAGACLVAVASLFVATSGFALRGAFRGDAFVSGAVGLATALVAVFTLFPVATLMAGAFHDEGALSGARAFAARLFTERVWGLACLSGPSRCGVAWNTLAVALAAASGCTLLGLAFALTVTRTRYPGRRALRVLTVLPIVTPPFVIGLGLILLFGRSGVVNQLLEWAFAVVPTRWIYGPQGILLAQLFAFTPVAFLVLIGVVEGVSPSMEEAAQTLRAGRWQTFSTISLPLMGPGVANAFLISFIESIADFGNPVLLGGNYSVLSTEIYFSIVGAQFDPGRAAALATLLLAMALAVFAIQRRVLAGRSYVTVSGKGDGGLATELPAGVRRAALAVVAPWSLLTLALYAMALVGGFVETWGRDYTPTLRHFVKAFEVTQGAHGLVWSGAAWNSFGTTVTLAAVAAPFTAGLGLLVGWLLSRQRFAGHAAFEFATLMSFAVPGTVIGVAYVSAFNVPPVEITGTALVIVLCFVFRNLPVGVRAGVAAMSQLDRSLDEASATLRARTATTVTRVVLPLLRPALAGALVYSFVRAMTTVSAVIFLVSAEYDLATTYIIGRVVNGDYGVAIAYCSVLIVFMVSAILAIQWLVGERRLGRRAAPTPAGVVPA